MRRDHGASTKLLSYVALQAFEADLKECLMEQHYVPAEAVRRRCEDAQGTDA